MPKIDVSCSEETNQTGYPPPYDAPMSKRYVRRLASALGIVDFGASYVSLLPGGWSSQRHWHESEDELLVMLEGHATLVENESWIVLGPGDMAAWAKGVPNAHHLINETDQPCRFLVIGRPPTSACHYPDIDLHFCGETGAFISKSLLPAGPNDQQQS